MAGLRAAGKLLALGLVLYAIVATVRDPAVRFVAVLAVSVAAVLANYLLLRTAVGG